MLADRDNGSIHCHAMGTSIECTMLNCVSRPAIIPLGQLCSSMALEWVAIIELCCRGSQNLWQMYFAVQVALQQSATDPTTGQIDMDSIQTGVSSSDRTKREQMAAEIMKVLESKLLLLETL